MPWHLVRDERRPLYPTMPGATTVEHHGDFGQRLREYKFGHRLTQDVFELRRGTPYFPEAAYERAPRIILEVRRDVGLASGDSRWLDAIAIGAFGDPPTLALTWVQTVRARPSSTAFFDGCSPRIENQVVPGDDTGFFTEGGSWMIDNGGAASARYSRRGVALRPLADPGGEVIYDTPDRFSPSGRWMELEPNVRSVRSVLQFRTYLCPRRDRQHPGWSGMEALALVEWSRSMYRERAEPGAPPFSPVSEVRVYWVVPNPLVSAPLRHALDRSWEA